MSFADILKRTREECGYTQAGLACRAGLKQAHISHFECGRRLPSYHNLLALKLALDVTADSLMEDG